ncbi:hypothetical protein, partial [Pseudomonas sp. N8]|uniref:hypothetical protein n=1 Tax=Pseudomonas sp. N8 TaxID=3449428 RepID=UPI003F695DD5
MEDNVPQQHDRTCVIRLSFTLLCTLACWRASSRCEAAQRPFLHYSGSFAPRHDRQKTADSVEKVGFSAGPNSGTTTTGEPTHHIEWFFGP